MEDEEETQSPQSPGSNGRITVTVAAPAPATAIPTNQNALTLALPIQQQPLPQQQQKPGGSGGREDCWSDGATAVLIDAWGERYLELSRGNLKQKHWKDVADIVSSREDYTKTPKTDIQCKNRIDTVKKKYKVEKAKMVAGGPPSKWRFFDKLDQLIGPSAKMNSTGAAGGAGSSGNLNVYAGNQRVPVGIPVGVRSAPNAQIRQPERFQVQQKMKTPQVRKRPPVESDEEETEPDASPESSDGLPPESFKRARVQREMMMINASGSGSGSGNGSAARPGMMNRKIEEGSNAGGNDSDKDRSWRNSVMELTRAIMKFGEAYEQAETAKLQQLVEMEKQRMKFAKELELQRMQFFMKTQLELSQLKHRRAGGNSNHRMSNNNTANNNNNNSDSSN